MPRRTKKTTKKTSVAAKKSSTKKRQSSTKAELPIRVLGKKPSASTPNPKTLELVAEKEEEIVQEMTVAKLKEKKKESERNTWEEVERSKRMILWSGVIFFMLLISVIWLVNTKKVVTENKLEKKSELTTEEWSSLVDSISDKIVEMKSNLEVIQEFEDSEKASTTEEYYSLPGETVEEESSSVTTEEIIDKTTTEKLKQQLEEKSEDKIKFIY